MLIRFNVRWWYVCEKGGEMKNCVMEYKNRKCKFRKEYKYPLKNLQVVLSNMWRYYTIEFCLASWWIQCWNEHWDSFPRIFNVKEKSISYSNIKWHKNTHSDIICFALLFFLIPNFRLHGKRAFFLSLQVYMWTFLLQFY